MTTRIRLNQKGQAFLMSFGVIGLIVTLFTVPALSTIIGTITGFLVGIFFGTPILKVLDAFGVSGVAMWELGCFLGFVSGFFSKMPKKSRESN